MIIVLKFEQFVLKNDGLETRLSNIQLSPKLENQQQIKSTIFQINVRSLTVKVCWRPLLRPYFNDSTTGYGEVVEVKMGPFE